METETKRRANWET